MVVNAFPDVSAYAMAFFPKSLSNTFLGPFTIWSIDRLLISNTDRAFDLGGINAPCFTTPFFIDK